MKIGTIESVYLLWQLVMARMENTVMRKWLLSDASRQANHDQAENNTDRKEISFD